MAWSQYLHMHNKQSALLFIISLQVAVEVAIKYIYDYKIELLTSVIFMYNPKVIEHLLLLWSFFEWLWSLFDIKLLTFFAAGFTIYFGYQKTSKKVCISYSISSSRIYDPHIPAIIISNKRDNSISISSIEMDINEKGKLTLVEFATPTILKGYESQKIDIPKYSNLRLHGQLYKLGILDDISFNLITTGGHKINCEIESNLTLPAPNMITKAVYNLNEIILTSRMMYIFFYKLASQEKHCIIDIGNFFNEENPFHFNYLANINDNILIDIMLNYGYHERFENYMCFKIDENLTSHLAFNKTQVEKIKNTVTDE